MSNRTPVAIVSLGLSVACFATTAIHWQWGFYPALESGTISNIFLYGSILVVLVMATAISIGATTYFVVRALIHRGKPSLAEGVRR